MEDKKTIRKKIEEVQDIYQNIGMEPLSILLGYDKNLIGKIYNSDNPKVAEEFENKIDMVLKEPKFIIELIQKHKYKITRKGTIEKIEKTIKNAHDTMNVKSILQEVKDRIMKFSSEIKSFDKIPQYIDIVRDMTIFKPRDFGENNNSIEAKEIKIDIYTSIIKKLDKMLIFYKDCTQNDIINTMLYEKAEQFLNEKAQDCSIERMDSTEKINEMINYYENMLLTLEDDRKIIPKKEIENIIKRYGISKKDLSKVLGCSEMTILRYSQDKNPINKENEYCEKLRKIRYNSNEMLKLLEIKRSEKEIDLENYKKYKEKIESTEFKKFEDIEQLGEYIKRLNEDQLNMIIYFLRSENNPSRISLQELIDESTLEIIEHSKRETTESIILKLYPEVMEKIFTLNFKYPKFSLNDIINTLIEKKLDQYVTYRIEDVKKVNNLIFFR